MAKERVVTTNRDAPAPARRRSQRLITQAEIMDAAFDVVDAEGLQGLSMRRLAEVAGVGVMTLYGFVANKEELLHSLRDHAVARLSAPPDPSLPWQEQLTLAMRGLWAAMSEHPGVVELLSLPSEGGQPLDQVRERLLNILRSAGLDDQTSVDALGVLVAQALGFAVAGHARRTGPQDQFYGRLNALPPEEYPNLTATAAEYAAHWSERAFDFGLRAIVDSLERGRVVTPAVAT
jgi:AcrR family transcriptional regulator